MIPTLHCLNFRSILCVSHVVFTSYLFINWLLLFFLWVLMFLSFVIVFLSLLYRYRTTWIFLVLCAIVRCSIINLGWLIPNVFIVAFDSQLLLLGFLVYFFTFCERCNILLHIAASHGLISSTRQFCNNRSLLPSFDQISSLILATKGDAHDQN